MKFADAFLRRMYGREDRGLTRLLLEHARVNGEMAEAEANRPKTVVWCGPGPASAKCRECGLDGNHDTWCPHWQPYVADES